MFHTIRNRRPDGYDPRLLPNPIDKETNAKGLAFAIIVKNEARFLAEWLAFHAIQGVSKFYVYNNLSDDDLAGAIADSGVADRVTCIEWGTFHLHVQLMAFNHAVATYGRHHSWMGFIDADEFLFCTDGRTLPQVLDSMPAHPVYAIPWHLYGTSGHQEHPEGLIIENFQDRGEFPFPAGQPKYVDWKIIVDPTNIDQVHNHIARPRGQEAQAMTMQGKVFSQWEKRNRDLFDEGPLRLNHYVTRSKSAFEAKLQRGSASSGGSSARVQGLRKLQVELDRTCVKDDIAAQFADQVRDCMANGLVD